MAFHFITQWLLLAGVTFTAYVTFRNDWSNVYLVGIIGAVIGESTPPVEGTLAQKKETLCFQTKLVPYKRSDGKVFGTGTGMATIIIDPEHLTYTRTIVFSDLSTPVDESYVHDKLMNLPGFPVNVKWGAYIQTFPENPLHADYFKNLKAKYVGIYLAFNDFDVLHGNVYTPCDDAGFTSPSSSAIAADIITTDKNLRGSAWSNLLHSREERLLIFFSAIILMRSTQVPFLQGWSAYYSKSGKFLCKG